MENEVFVNGITENRRGKKLFDGDVIEVFNTKYIVKEKSCEN